MKNFDYAKIIGLAQRLTPAELGKVIYFFFEEEKNKKQAAKTISKYAGWENLERLIIANGVSDYTLQNILDNHEFQSITGVRNVQKIVTKKEVSLQHSIVTELSEKIKEIDSQIANTDDAKTIKVLNKERQSHLDAMAELRKNP